MFVAMAIIAVELDLFFVFFYASTLFCCHHAADDDGVGVRRYSLPPALLTFPIEDASLPHFVGLQPCWFLGPTNELLLLCYL